MQVIDEAHTASPIKEKREAFLSLLEGIEHHLAAQAWSMYKEYGRGLFFISDQQIKKDLPPSNELIRWWRPGTYHTEDTLRAAGLSDAQILELKQFIDSYDPDLDVLIQHVRLDGFVSIYVLRTDPRPPDADRFLYRSN